jgi:hypothetical protein
MKPVDGLASLVALFRSMHTAVVCNPGSFYLAVFKRWCNGKHIWPAVEVQ